MSEEQHFHGPRGTVTVEHAFDGPRLKLALHTLAASWMIDLDVGERPALDFRFRAGRGGPVARSPGTWWVGQGGWSGILADTLVFARNALAGNHRASCTESSVTAVEAHLRAIAAKLEAAVDPAAAKVARCFSPAARFWVYAALRRDPTGRVRQLVDTCPGALLLASEHHAEHVLRGRHGHRAAEERIVADIVAGLPLRPLLRRAAEGWASLPWERARRKAQAPLLGTPGRDVDAVMARTRLLLRRATRLVRPSDLTRASLLPFVPEDVPRNAVWNARWFDALARSVDFLEGRAEPARGSVSRFVSRSARALDLLARRQRHPGLGLDLRFAGLVQVMADYAEATGHLPTLCSDPAAYVEAARRWEEPNTASWRLASLLRRIPSLGLGEVTAVRALGSDSVLWGVEGLPFPAAPGSEEQNGFVARPIRSTEDLEEEGWEMDHCAPSLLPDLVSGDRWLYSVRVGEERLTLEIARGSDGGFEIVDLRGRGNRYPTLEGRRTVESWVSRLRPPGGPCPSQAENWGR